MSKAICLNSGYVKVTWGYKKLVSAVWLTLRAHVVEDRGLLTTRCLPCRLSELPKSCTGAKDEVGIASSLTQLRREVG